MPITLNAPNVDCPDCEGRGSRVRDLKLIINGLVADQTTQVLMHCGCLSAELAAAHSVLDTTGILQDWPWDDIKDQQIPQAEGGPEPRQVGSPYPAALAAAPSSPPAKPSSTTLEPDSIPNPAKPKRKRKPRK